MILGVTLSKPGTNVKDILGKDFIKIKITIENSSKGTGYFAQMFTKTQVFHQHFTQSELEQFLTDNAGTTFKNCVKRTETEEITILANKKGKITELHKKLNTSNGQNQEVKLNILPPPASKKKNYLLNEGTPVPFLVMLGVMTSEGKVISSRYDKFRQINRFLEFIDDVLPNFTMNTPSNESDSSTARPLRIVDFGCGKSYLTFAVHYFLTQIKHIPCQIEGLDLKQDVIDYCNEMAEKLKLEGLIFHTGNIADFNAEQEPDIVITLHACDTATDYALKYAVEKKAKVILSVPCCQHQINGQLSNTPAADVKAPADSDNFSPLLKWGIIREKFSALLTDALRGEWLESQGYKVQMLEFIDMEHTPKNLLIRAVRQEKSAKKQNENPVVIKTLGITPEIWKESLNK